MKHYGKAPIKKLIVVDIKKTGFAETFTKKGVSFQLYLDAYLNGLKNYDFDKPQFCNKMSSSNLLWIFNGLKKIVVNKAVTPPPSPETSIFFLHLMSPSLKVKH